MKILNKGAIMKALLCTVMLLGLGGCSKEYVVGKKIAKEDINEFYYTEATSSFPPTYQRYHLYVEDGKHYFYHEKREGEAFPLTEEYITVKGTIELDENTWDEFFSLLENGKVKKRNEDVVDGGDAGPWLYLYWKNDRSDIQEFSFEDYGKEKAFEELCKKLVEEDTDQ